MPPIIAAAAAALITPRRHAYHAATPLFRHAFIIYLRDAAPDYFYALILLFSATIISPYR